MITLAILAIVVACISWTVTQEEVFREPREHCKHLSLTCRLLAHRKFFYLFTCEYCFSHYVAAVVLWFSNVQVHNFAEIFFAWFTLVWVANIYMSLFRLLRVTIKLVGNRAKIAEANAKLALYQLPPSLRETP